MFVKLFTQILDSSIADDRRLRHFFTDLLLCADVKGYVMMTPAAIARRTGASLEEVEWGLEQLSQPDPASKTKDHDGRRIDRVEESGYGWVILNYEMYRSLRDADQLREAARKRVERHRAKKKEEKESADVTPVTHDVTPVTLGNAITEGEEEADAEEEVKKENMPKRSAASSETNELLEEIWNLSPKKSRIRSSKKQVRTAWSKVPASERPSRETVISAYRKWLKCEDWKKDGGQYVPGLHRWINDQQWENVPEPERRVGEVGPMKFYD